MGDTSAVVLRGILPLYFAHTLFLQPTERFGQGANFDGTNVDGEAAMKWFVEEVLSCEASSQGKNESPSAKVRKTKSKWSISKLHSRWITVVVLS